MLQRIHTFLTLPAERRSLALEAAWWLLVARLVLVVVPFPVIGRRLGSLRTPSPTEAAHVEQEHVAKQVGWATNLLAERLPLRLVCLPRALAAWHMLARRGIASRLHFGALRDEGGKITTHAWLSCGRAEVTGYPEAYACSEMGFYAR